MFKWLKQKLTKRRNDYNIGSTVSNDVIINNNLPSSEVPLIVDKVKNGGNLTLREINLILAERLNIVSIISNTVKLQEVIMTDAVFIVDEVMIKLDKNNNPIEVIFRMKELTYGLNLDMNISSKDFHDVFKPFETKSNELTGDQNDSKG